MTKVLIVEDDVEAALTMQKGLSEQGFESVVTHDGEAGLKALREGEFDVVVLDRMMPGLDGVSMLEIARSEGMDVPVLFLSALGELEDRVYGLKAGADDYLVKPYALVELVARLEALLRRKDTGAVETTLRVGDLEMNLISRVVKRGNSEIDLQPREFQLLEFLMRHVGQSVTRTMLLEKVWAYHFDPQTNVIDVHISRLRAKLDKGFDRAMLHTVRGEGYQLKP
ncbi:response regulator transcription factor [Asticcacaulis excentricus]|uniref:Two component transcriptional regulator, winged helix family n=1 Tax=Asticcacaulis excentricus (strain ATCC 15261 / DSM 4724 / KCTC 12464 / NCIMB 9791 / VKM B-1370 / CB 48) TaxID=573065 RepID=E8RL19_ASTEC|nr:response regulator transcription factor [Asticcacaulis excentricus]ADU13632.1 two component transcriptional regulator, winged helix family [Asticcacaulis excentricus CB 48]